LDFSRPGKLTDNPFIESFNGSFRDECLSTNWSLSLHGRTPQEAENEYILETKKADFSNNAWS
ncbi:MAG: integrase core domain-containing protein, partial [Bacteroidales bacterium]|nr:integrase core domain-containing protein [Bacteroidales bacterium]